MQTPKTPITDDTRFSLTSEGNAALDVAAPESVRQASDGMIDAPRPEWVRGECPQCGQPLVSNCYWVGGRGYIIAWECWHSLGEKPTCTYRRVL